MPNQPSLGELRAALGLYELTRMGTLPSTSDRPNRLLAKWACGCSASGDDMRSMEHGPCSRHERIEACPAFPGDRRKNAAR